MIKLITIFIFSSMLFSQKTIQILDSLKSELEVSQADTNKVKLLKDLSFKNYNVNPDEGIKYGLQGVKLAKELRWKKGEAICYNALGVIYSFGKGDFDTATEYYEKTLKISRLIKDSTGMAGAIGNIAIIKRRQGKFDSAIELYLESINIYRALNNKIGLAKNYMNLGTAYEDLNENENALKYYNKSLELKSEFNNKVSIAQTKANIAITLSKVDSLERSLQLLNEAIDVVRSEKLDGLIGRTYQNIAKVYFKRESFYKALDLLDSAEYYTSKFGNPTKVAVIYANKGFAYLVINDSNLITKEDINITELKKDFYVQNAIKYLNKSYQIFDSTNILGNNLETIKNLAEAYSRVDNYKKSAELLAEYIELKNQEFNSEKTEIIARMQTDQEIIEQQNQIKLLKEKEALNKKKNFYVILATSIVLILIFLIISQYQKKESEGLLLNILPKKIADRLKKKENNIADDIQEATIIFIDMVDFTKKMHGKPADRIVKYLSGFFETIDSLVVKYKLEKIKTIGDGYMVASGVPNYNPNNKVNACRFVIELLEISSYPVRIGMDSGRVSAGIIGNMKFAYDVWGETVNMASRMESLGETGKIQVTEQFAQSLSSDFKFKERGLIDIKGYGTIKTFF